VLERAGLDEGVHGSAAHLEPRCHFRGTNPLLAPVPSRTTGAPNGVIPDAICTCPSIRRRSHLQRDQGDSSRSHALVRRCTDVCFWSNETSPAEADAAAKTTKAVHVILASV
jgi:hypothetical protein